MILIRYLLFIFALLYSASATYEISTAPVNVTDDDGITQLVEAGDFFGISNTDNSGDTKIRSVEGRAVERGTEEWKPAE